MYIPFRLKEPYILIANAVIMMIGNFLMFRLAFDDEFEERFTRYQNQVKERMISENERFVTTMRGIIELDPESIEVMGFREKWNKHLEIIDIMKEQRDRLETRVQIVYFPLLVSILFATAGLAVPGGLRVPYVGTVYLTSFSWWLLALALLLMLWMLLQHYLLERRFSNTEALEKALIREAQKAGEANAEDFDKY